MLLPVTSHHSLVVSVSISATVSPNRQMLASVRQGSLASSPTHEVYPPMLPSRPPAKRKTRAGEQGRHLMRECVDGEQIVNQKFLQKN